MTIENLSKLFLLYILYLLTGAAFSGLFILAGAPMWVCVAAGMWANYKIFSNALPSGYVSPCTTN